MRVTYPLGWNDFTPDQKKLWWKRHVVDPMKTIEDQMAKNVEDGKRPFTNLTVPDVKKTIAEELAGVRAVFKYR